MYSGLFERFQRRRLGMSQPWFRAALGKRPAPTASRPDQQELDTIAAPTVANRSNLFALAQLAELR
jgi:hypothetical protein